MWSQRLSGVGASAQSAPLKATTGALASIRVPVRSPPSPAVASDQDHPASSARVTGALAAKGSPSLVAAALGVMVTVVPSCVAVTVTKPGVPCAPGAESAT
jgi:hypothetical protein